MAKQQTTQSKLNELLRSWVDRYAHTGNPDTLFYRHQLTDTNVNVSRASEIMVDFQPHILQDMLQWNHAWRQETNTPCNEEQQGMYQRAVDSVELALSRLEQAQSSRNSERTLYSEGRVRFALHAAASATMLFLWEDLDAQVDYHQRFLEEQKDQRRVRNKGHHRDQDARQEFWVAHLYKHAARIVHTQPYAKAPDKLPHDIVHTDTASARSVISNEPKPFDLVDGLLDMTKQRGTGTPVSFRLLLTCLMLARSNYTYTDTDPPVAEEDGGLLSHTFKIKVGDLLKHLYTNPPESVHRWYPALVRAYHDIAGHEIRSRDTTFQLCRIHGLVKGKEDHHVLTKQDELRISVKFDVKKLNYITCDLETLIAVSTHSKITLRMYLLLLADWHKYNHTLQPPKGKQKRKHQRWYHTKFLDKYPTDDVKEWKKRLQNPTLSQQANSKLQPANSINWLVEQGYVVLREGRLIPPLLTTTATEKPKK